MLIDVCKCIYYTYALLYIMTQVVRKCRYSCGTQLSEFDKNENKYREVDGTLHTRQRCESLKQGPKDHDNGNKGFCTKWHESYVVLNPYWKCCPYCCEGLVK
jgi:hypothetical protein